MNITRIETPHINKNDCWNIVLSKATNRSYEEIREMFKDYLDENDSLRQKEVSQYLKDQGYSIIDFRSRVIQDKASIKIISALKSFNAYKVVIASFEKRKELHHLSYYENGKHYTTSDTDESFEDPVLFVWIKIKEENHG